MYPDKIILVTRNNRDDAVSYFTDDITVLPADVSDYELGKYLVEHIHRSRVDAESYEYFREFRQTYKKKGKFRTEKATMLIVKYASVSTVDGVFTFLPYRNLFPERGWKAFHRIPENLFVRELGNDYAQIGRSMRDAWDKSI